MQVIDDVIVCGEPIDENAMRQIRNCRQACEYAALMADHHTGYNVPIGGVIASQTMISPAAVGFDIACGNKAALLDADAADVKRNISKIMDDISRQISFGIGRSSAWSVDDPLFDSDAWRMRAAAPHKELARKQLGTVGGGNHYVDLFEDEQGRIWVGVHFGSRGLGHKIASWFLEKTGASSDMMAPPTMLEASGTLGSEYVESMELAGRYAYAGRDAVVARVAGILNARIMEEVHNHHNFAWLEEHGGAQYWVCRKGATPAFPGQKGFVGGSMGDDSVILGGIEGDQSQQLFYSTVHGAGRVMSRTQATGRSRWGKKRGEGLISPEMMNAWIREKGVVLRGGDTDEAPQAYKRLHEVLPQQGNSIRVLHTLRPLGVVMAGPDVRDPYKD